MSALVSEPEDPALFFLQHVFGYPAFRGAQGEIVRHVAQGQDALVLMPTGGGKSLCYQIPALIRQGCAVVVSPLIALMQDQVSALLELGVRAAFLNSTQTWDDSSAIEEAFLLGELDLLYVAPERLLTPRFMSLLDQVYCHERLALFAIDEAHCVSQWGHDFRPEYLQLSALPQRFAHIPRIALTATADARTQEEIAERLQLTQARHFVASFDRPNIHYSMLEKDNPRAQLLRFLKTVRTSGREAGIVYCFSRRKVDETAEWLTIQGYTALPYHAGLEQYVRSENQSRFLREDGIIMVATIAFGMGIDKPDVRFVAHLDLPRSLESYYQETGRAGRDGAPAQAWMVWGTADIVQQRRMIDESEGNEAFKQQAYQRLDHLVGFVQTCQCRRQYLLGHFGEQIAACGNCDNCLHPPETEDYTEAARKALSCVYRTGQRYGMNYLIDVLRGVRTPKIIQAEHETLPVFNIGADIEEQTWKMLFRQLTANAFLSVDPTYKTLALTEMARPLLRGEMAFMLRKVAPSNSLAQKRRRTSVAIPGGVPSTLYERLRQWRIQTAKQRNVPAYAILHDATLNEIARVRPRSLSELGQVTGIGDRKLLAYGQAILGLLAGEQD